MSKNKKIFIGILSFLPLLLMGAYFIAILGFFVPFFRGGMPPDDMPDFMNGNFIGMFVMIGLMIMFSLGMLIYFIIHVANNKALDSTEKLVWILVIVFASTIGYPIYWYMKIWKENNTGDELKTAS